MPHYTSRIAATGNTILVFNPLSWKRDGLVELELPRGHSLMDPATAQPIPAELVRRVEEEDYDTVRFWAKDIPSLGYRCFALVEGATSVPANRAAAGDPAPIENAFYGVKIDPDRGGIASIYDKQLERELVDARSPYAFGQYVYVAYGYPGESLIRQRTVFGSTLLSYSMALPQPNRSAFLRSTRPV